MANVCENGKTDVLSLRLKCQSDMEDEINYNRFYDDIQFEVRYCYLKEDAFRLHFEVHHNNSDVPMLLAGYIDLNGNMKVEYDSPFYMDKVVHYRIGLVFDYIRDHWSSEHSTIFRDHYSDQKGS